MIELFRFIDWIIRLPDNMEIEFKHTIDQIEEEQKMAYVTSVERIATEQGIQQGMQQGMQQGKLQAGLTMVREFNFSVEEVAEKLNISAKDLMEQLNQDKTINH